LIALIPLAIASVAVSLTIGRSMQDEYIQFNTHVMDILCLRIEESIARSTDVAHRLSTNRALLRLAAEFDASRADTDEALREIAEHTRFIDAQRNFNIATAVYLPNREFIVMGSFISRDPAMFYDTHLNFDQINARDFYEMAVNAATPGYTQIMQSESGRLGRGSYITYIQHIHTGTPQRRAFLLSFISMNEMERMIMGNTPQGSLFTVTASDGTWLMGFAGLDDGIRPPGNGTWTAELEGGRYFATRHDLLRSGMQIVIYIPYDYVMQSMVRFQNVLLVVIILIATAGLLAAWLLAHRQYAPLGRLLKQVLPKDAPKRVSEYDYLSTRIEEMRLQNDQFVAEIKAQSDRIRNDALIGILVNRDMTGQEIEARLMDSGLAFPWAAFCVVFIKEFPSAEQFPVFQDGTVMPCRLSSSDIVLVISGEPGDPCVSAVEAELRALCEKHPQMAVGFSGGASGVQELPVMFHEAAVAANTQSQNAVHTIEDAVQSSGGFHYPMDKEVQIMAALHEGDYDLCKTLLHTIKTENEEKRRVSPIMMTHLYHAMISTAYRVYDSLRLEERAPLLIALRALGTSADNEGKFAKILDMYRAICESYQQNQEMKSMQFINLVVRYIQENSHDPKLTLDVIANQFSVSYFYLSRMFQEATGHSFTDILNKSRVKRAMQYLDETGDTVQNVALKSGFTNLNTFLRAFRKDTGTTPNNYRKLNSGH